MQLKIVNVPSIKEPITRSPGFVKKGLSDYKLDLCALCGFGCIYCSSNCGNYLRINRKPFAELARQQIGQALTPLDDPHLTYAWPDVLDKLQAQLDRRRRHRRRWSEGKTLVFSMLTDGFSPHLVTAGFTEQALRMVLEQTSFRIRVLTKNAIVGTDKWVKFFSEHRDRFVVGLSTGTLDNEWAKRVEIGTSAPSARLRALRHLQDAGVPTFGMLCPVFPDVLAGDGVERLMDAIRPDRVEHVWAEPYNDRENWKQVRAGYPADSAGYAWLTDTYEKRRRGKWSAYATDLYARLRDKAQQEGWSDKLRYLLYEFRITRNDAASFAGLTGLWLQSKIGPDGLSKNRYIADLQRAG